MTAATTLLDSSQSPRPASIARSRALDTVPATLVLTALSVVTAVGFGRVFDGWSFLSSMVFVVVASHVVCLVLRVLNLPGYVAVPASLLVLFALIAWKYYPGTLSGPFPTSTTWRIMSADLRLARDQFPSATAPVAPVGGFIVAATAATGVAALLADAFAFRAYGRAEAAVPTAVLFVFASALGVDNHRVVLTAAWFGVALAVIAVLRVTHGRTEQSWIGKHGRVLLSALPLAAALATVAAIGGAVIGPGLPGAGEEGLVDTRDKNNVTQVVSPLVDIRSRLINLSDVEMFSVESSEPHYWRVTGLSDFDGTTWGIPEGTRGGNFPDRAPQGGTRVLNQEILIKGLAGKLVPAAFSPGSVDGGSAYYVPLTATIVEPGVGLKRNTNYHIVSTVLDLTPDVLRSATSLDPPDDIELELPPDFPGSVAQLALEITAPAQSVYDKMILLQQYFQSNFTYSLAVQRGHSDSAIENFLRIKQGYCEQFSATFAAMARSIGIPARVAVGFTYGDLDENGRYHVYGRNAHAWPEVWFDRIGWVSFEPTPGRGEPGTQAYTGLGANQEAPTGGDGGGTPLTVPADPTATTAAPPTTLVPTATTIAEPRPQAADPNATGADDAAGDSGGLSTPTIVVLLLLLLGVVWALALPRLVRVFVWRKVPDDPREQIAASWAAASRALGMIGLAPELGETPLEHAARAEKMSAIDRRTLRELALSATAAIYGGIGDDQTAARCSVLSTTIVNAVRDRLNTGERIAARFDPRRASKLVAR